MRLTLLWIEHFNTEEKELLVRACSDYQELFYLPGDKLNSAGATQHSISVEPGTEPVNTGLYRLPEMQKMEVDK